MDASSGSSRGRSFWALLKEELRWLRFSHMDGAGQRGPALSEGPIDAGPSAYLLSR